ncbi:DNA repair protein RecN [Alteromonas sp. ASW11-130]|uniref:DNA repair protein RecN n=1 Tax=Alteromonas sp. ASW11-130 TaxID=3015775 RepID=UPI0022422D02|nr:DNA repair protein RecN [Alteromonas sp. ASW11-130]MCW8091421.1 DNA repair protein RecN [Alteromonas sp. ASW11-130]
MLVHLSVKNFAIVKQLSVSFEQGMTAITGETGAGKSIAIDALSLCLGARADANAVRNGAEKAEIVAHFSLADNQAAVKWLDELELRTEDEADVCFIRRVISREGRSKAFINGSPVSLQQLKQLGQYFISIHGQNAHLQLLKEEHQRQLVDSFAKHDNLLLAVKQAYRDWQTIQSEHIRLQDEAQTRTDRQQLLAYQAAELDEFGLAEDEFAELEVEHKRVSNSQALLEEAQHSVFTLYENDDANALSMIQGALDKLEQLQESDANLAPVVSMLNEASIQVEEAAKELRRYCDKFDLDPELIQEVEARFAKTMELSRKHMVPPEELYRHHQTILSELNVLQADETKLEGLQQQVDDARTHYLAQAKQLTESRQEAAQKLSTSVEKQIKQMNMPHAQVSIDVTTREDIRPGINGVDEVVFKVSTNPGQSLEKLEKVVSGGELSRIGLAVQVIAQDSHVTPTMIFDEVDTGISGPTASIVGNLLRQLGTKSQVMCVTHLPQVAAQAHNQLFVTKVSTEEQTETRILPLTKQDRIDELARLLAGDKVTDTALANARELLKSVESN